MNFVLLNFKQGRAWVDIEKDFESNGKPFTTISEKKRKLFLK